jgi:hypothetical protein
VEAEHLGISSSLKVSSPPPENMAGGFLIFCGEVIKPVFNLNI